MVCIRRFCVGYMLQEIRNAQGLMLYQKYLQQLQGQGQTVDQQRMMTMAQDQANQEIMQVCMPNRAIRETPC